MSKLSLSVEPGARRALAPLDDAMRLLAAASDPAEVKHIESLAAAAKRYASSLEARNYAAEIQLRAGRKGGQMLIDMADNGTRGKGRARKESPAVTLSGLHIEPMRSSRWHGRPSLVIYPSARAGASAGGCGSTPTTAVTVGGYNTSVGISDVPASIKLDTLPVADTTRKGVLRLEVSAP